MGTACDDGAGDEVCGFDLELTGLGGVTFSTFTPDAGADLLVNLTGTSVRINGLDALAPTPGRHRLGELVVNTPMGGAVELTIGEVIGADLSSESLATSTLVSVPEPASLLMIVSGALGLAGLARRRATR